MARICPILPLTGVEDVIYTSSFVRELQRALKEVAQREGNPRFDPGPVDGNYGPSTAAALREFQRSYPVDTWQDLLLGLTGREYASCATYNLLGLRCSGVTPVIGVTGDEALVMLILASERAGAISLKCPQDVEPLVPPKYPWLAWGLLAGFVAFVGYFTFKPR